MRWNALSIAVLAVLALALPSAADAFRPKHQAKAPAALERALAASREYFFSNAGCYARNAREVRRLARGVSRLTPRLGRVRVARWAGGARRPGMYVIASRTNCAGVAFLKRERSGRGFLAVAYLYALDVRRHDIKRAAVKRALKRAKRSRR